MEELLNCRWFLDRSLCVVQKFEYCCTVIKFSDKQDLINIIYESDDETVISHQGEFLNKACVCQDPYLITYSNDVKVIQVFRLNLN